jgi:hypothetical protein
MKPTVFFSFPQGGNFGSGSGGSHYDNDVYSGGGGWYGGSGGNNGGEGGATGGSSFISGMAGCVAIEWPPTGPFLELLNNAYGGHGVEELRGWRYLERTTDDVSVMTIGGRDYIFTDASMVDGQGYQWNAGSKSQQPTEDMPNPADGLPMTGNVGDGYARIALVPPNNP